MASENAEAVYVLKLLGRTGYLMGKGTFAECRIVSSRYYKLVVHVVTSIFTIEQ